MLQFLEARGANTDLSYPVCLYLDSVEVGLEAPPGPPFGMGDPVTGNNPFVAKMTDLSHSVLSFGQGLSRIRVLPAAIHGTFKDGK